MSAAGLYFHIPFCDGKCPYCDFYSRPADEGEMDRYVRALCRALDHAPSPGAADTVYFGGGTPSLLGAGRLLAVLEHAARRFPIASGAEITLEANPSGDLTDLLPALQSGGFNRISFGVQSLNDRELRALGRRHTAGQAAASIQWAAQSGFSNISADLMLGIPHQTPESLARSVGELTALPVTHASAYLLKVEERTPFAERQISALCPGEDEAAQLYLDCVALLGQRGLEQYEISNFAKPGFPSRHNLKYWNCEPYLGIGPSAHSCLDGRRFSFPRSLDDFLLSENPFSLIEPEGEGGGWEEYAMLRLRLREGLDLKYLEQRYGIDAAPLLRRAAPLVKRGLLRAGRSAISFTPEGFLLSNTLTAKLLWG